MKFAAWATALTFFHSTCVASEIVGSFFSAMRFWPKELVIVASRSWLCLAACGARENGRRHVVAREEERRGLDIAQILLIKYSRIRYLLTS